MKDICKLLRAIAGGTDAKESRHDIIFIAAADLIDRITAERDGYKEQLEAWFDTSAKITPDISKLLMDGLRGYIRTAKNGGMPTKTAAAAEAVLEDFCRLYVGNLLTPYIAGLATSSDADAESGGVG